jgi:arginyl-tRNA synthetase
MPDTRTIRPHLEQLVLAAARDAIAAGDLPDVALPDAAIERPKDAANGDYASTIAMRLAR